MSSGVGGGLSIAAIISVERPLSQMDLGFPCRDQIHEAGWNQRCQRRLG